MPHLPASAALARFRVIDLTQVRAGPTACRQLADWGADVIHVQMPEHMRGDDEVAGQAGKLRLTSNPTGVYKAHDGIMNIATFDIPAASSSCAAASARTTPKAGVPSWKSASRVLSATNFLDDTTR